MREDIKCIYIIKGMTVDRVTGQQVLTDVVGILILLFKKEQYQYRSQEKSISAEHSLSRYFIKTENAYNRS